MGKYIIVLCAAPILGLTGCSHTRETKLTPTQEKTVSANVATAAKTQPAAYFQRVNGQACTEEDWHQDYLHAKKLDCRPVDPLIGKCSSLEYKRMGDMTPADLRVLEQCKQLSPEARTASEAMARHWMQAVCPLERDNERRNPELVLPELLAECRSLGF